MKSILSLLPLVLWSGHAFASAPIEGTWKFVDVTCLSGAIPDKATFDVTDGELSVVPTGQDESVTLRMVTPQCRIVLGPAMYKESGSTMTPVSPSGTIRYSCGLSPEQVTPVNLNAYTYVLTGPSLVLTAEPSRTQGTCPVGDSQVFKFLRVK